MNKTESLPIQARLCFQIFPTVLDTLLHLAQDFMVRLKPLHA